MNSYSSLLKPDRRRGSKANSNGLIAAAESDRGRLLYSAPFRRLQQKAQVFSLEENAAVRSRLTHSLEVAHIGRYLSDLIGQRLSESAMITAEQRIALISFVETACLMHDIGNPPFGHFGESAIQNWFKTEGAKSLSNAISAPSIRPEEIQETLADFLEFDGNPQGFRIVTRLQWNTDEFGLNLTHTTLAAYLKYLRSPISKNRGHNFSRKPGFFSTESSIASEIWNSFSYDSHAPQRFPLTYIMEAADDIAYCVSDLEDSIEKGFISQRTAFEEISKEWNAFSKSKNEDYTAIANLIASALGSNRPNGEQGTFTDFRTSLNRLIVDRAATRYYDNHDKVLNGTLDSLLPRDEESRRILDILQDFCRRNVYRHNTVELTELTGFRAITGILEHFRILLDISYERFACALDYMNKDHEKASIVIEKKLLSLFPRKHILNYRHQLSLLSRDDELRFSLDEWNLRAHLIVDFVSGMTDDFSLRTYQTLSGIKTS